MHTDQFFLRRAIELAIEGMSKGRGGPFGALITKEGQIIAQSSNQVYQNLDPTAHAEIEAIRAACRQLGTRKLEDCTIYSSCEPCPMCYSALRFAGIDRIVYAASHADAGRIAGFGMEELYAELSKSISERLVPSEQLLREEGWKPFEEWRQMQA